MPTTSEYLTSLQNDLDTIVSTLGLQEGTNFTDIKNATLNGDITTGGGDVSDYFTSNMGTDTDLKRLFKKIPAFAYSGSTCKEYFRGCTKLEEVDLSLFNTSSASTFEGMFRACYALKSVDLSNFNFSNAMSGNYTYMFAYCENLESVTFPSNPDFSYMYTTSSMFTGCTKLEEIDLSSWGDTTNNNLSYMFQNCRSLKSVDLSNFTTSSPLTASSQANQMFIQCSSMQRLDMRKYDFSATGAQALLYLFQGLPSNCLIIVKDTACKDAILSQNSWLTNIKTVAELEE